MAATYDGLVWTAGHLPEAYSPGDKHPVTTEEVMVACRRHAGGGGAGFDARSS